MFTTLTRRAVAVLMLTAGLASADNQTKTDEFQLTRRDFTELAFKPGAAGPIKIEADWKGTGVIKKDIALKMQLLRPDGSVAKEATGGSPLPVTFALTAAKFNQNKGKNYKVVLRHNAAGQDDEKVKGTLKVTFPTATVTVFDDSAKPIDLAGKGAKTEVSFTIPNKLGKLEVNIAFKDGLFNTKNLVAQLVRADGQSVNAEVDDSGLKLTRNVAQADLDKGLTWKVKLTNNGNPTVKGIKIVAKFTPN